MERRRRKRKDRKMKEDESDPYLLSMKDRNDGEFKETR